MPRGMIGERIYRRLLTLYPRDFSDEYADEMARLYRDRVRDEGATSVWLAFVADLACTAPSEQISTLAHDVRHACRAPDRLRERCQSRARARNEPTAGARTSRGARRASGAPGAATAHGERFVGARQRHLRTHSSRWFNAGVAGAHARHDPARR